MGYSKSQIYNMTLSALMLAKEVTEIDTDKSNEVRVLNIWWNTALEHTLQDLDLDSLSTPIALEKIATLDEGPWRYVYKYPSKCAFMRRLVSGAVTDNERTHLSKRVAVYLGQKAIFTNEVQAVADCIPLDVPLAAFSAPAATALAQKLAALAGPLLVGKGAKTLVKEINDQYIISKTEAQETDSRENFNYEEDRIRSSWVDERTS